MTKKKTEKIDYKKIAEDLATENARLNEALLRERADATNVRNRAEQDKLQLSGYYKALVIKEFLPTIDNFERAIKVNQNADQKDDFLKGLESIYKQFTQTLSKLGVERIKTVGELFDPELHEAVTMDDREGSSTASEEVVSEELQSGYRMGDEVIRHAMVRVKLQ